MKEKNTKKRLINSAGILLGMVIVAFMAKKFVGNWQEIRPYLTECRILLFVFSIFLYAIAFSAIGWNWAQMLYHMDQTLLTREYMHLHMSSVLAKYIPGGIWNIVGKAYLCAQRGVEKSTTMASIILEYVFQIISSGLFFLFLLPLLLKAYITPPVMVGLVILILLVCMLLPWGASVGMRILGKVFKEDLTGVELKRRDIYHMLSRYVVMWLFTGAGLVAMAFSFMKLNSLQSLSLVFSYPVSWVAGFLSPSPNGMGVREGVLQLLLENCYEEGPLLLIVLTTRIWTILGEILAVGCFQIYYKITDGHCRTNHHRKEENI